MEKTEIGKIIYEEYKDGSIKESNIENYIQVSGVWDLYGINEETSERRCLNVGKSLNIGNELLYDIACLHFLKSREDGSIAYVSQFEEDCGFKYESNQVQEFLYPHIALHWHSLKFIYVHNVSDQIIERTYAQKHNAKY